MSKSPEHLLSIVIVNRNTADLLMDCLEHVYASDLPHTPQVVVVDNGSTDDSVEKVRQNYPHVQIIEAGRNLGFAAASNRAIERAEGDVLLLVNTDAMLEKDCARKLMNLITEDPHAGMVGPQLMNEDGTRQTSYEAVPTLATETLNRSLLKRLFPRRFPGKHRLVSGPESVEALIGATMMVRREALDHLGRFDEDYFFFLEETDLAVRMRCHGWKVMFEPRARAVHLQGATAKTYAGSARIEFYRSRYLFFQKHYGSAARKTLKAVLMLNLTLNVVALGSATLVTLGRARGLTARFRVMTQLWKWHLQGCPEGPGLPRD